MFVEGLRELCAKGASTTKLLSSQNGKGVNTKSDPSTLGIVFMAFLCAVLPLDISQLSFAILGAVLYALLQKSDQLQAKKKPVSAVVNGAPYNASARAPKPKVCPIAPPSRPASQTKPVLAPTVNPEIRSVSAQPIAAPTFHSHDWEGEIQELLLQITPTPEAESIVNQIAHMVRQTTQSLIPEIEVKGFANGNFTCGKAFGVAVPEVDIVVSISPQIIFSRLHGRDSQYPAQLDVKKLQKAALRACTDRLVSSAGFKFRRSAFRGQEPKVTLLAPASLGFSSEAIPIDFSVNAVTPLYNAALLAECGSMDRRAKELILIVKRWAKDRGICHAAKGHLSPYMWGLLSIYFLQVGSRDEGPLLPPLEQFVMGLLKGQKIAGDTLKQPGWKPSVEPRQSAGALFREFVHFFETQFDWSNEAVSIRTGRRASPSSAFPLHIIVSGDTSTSQVGPSIEDPFHKGQNLGDGMNAVSLARLREELARAEALCLRGASLSELLEPWVPPEAPEPRDDEQGDVSGAMKKSPDVPSKVEVSQTQAAIPPWRRPGTRVASQAIA